MQVSKNASRLSQVFVVQMSKVAVDNMPTHLNLPCFLADATRRAAEMHAAISAWVRGQAILGSNVFSKPARKDCSKTA